MPAYQNPYSSSYVESSFGDAFGSQMPYELLRAIKISPWETPIEINIGVDPDNWKRNSKTLLEKPYKRTIKEPTQVETIYGEFHSGLLEIGSISRSLSWWLNSSEEEISEEIKRAVTAGRSQILEKIQADLEKRRAEIRDAQLLNEALQTCQPISLGYDFQYQGKSILINGSRFLRDATTEQKKQVLSLLQQEFIPDPKTPGKPIFQKGKPKSDKFRVKFSDVEDKVTWNSYFEAWEIDI